MADPFKGRWQNLVCAGPPEVQALLAGATLDISDTNEVTWNLPGAQVHSPGRLEDGRLRGELRAEGRHCYYEIVVRTPPPHLRAPRRCIYGTFSTVQDHRNGDLGDPGTWTAEESGPRGDR